jgi:hypothetical protein
LNSGHSFSKKSIEEWIKTTNKPHCPICRVDIKQKIDNRSLEEAINHRNDNHLKGSIQMLKENRTLKEENEKMKNKLDQLEKRDFHLLLNAIENNNHNLGKKI